MRILGFPIKGIDKPKVRFYGLLEYETGSAGASEQMLCNHRETITKNNFRD